MSNELALTIEQRAELQRCERVIQSGLETFELVGNALLSIRDSRLYCETHDNFDSYCREKWSMKRDYADKLIGASKVAANLHTIVCKPQSESQARPLTKLETPAEQREAWQEAVTESGGQPTARHVEAAVERVQSRSRPIPEVKSDRKPRGSYEDWKSFQALSEDIAAQIEQMEQLVVDAQHVIQARDLAAKLSKRLRTISENQ